MLHESEKVSIDDIRKILKYIAKGYKVNPIIYDTIRKIAVKEIEDKNRVVLYKRDPNVERGRIQGAYVTIIDGETIDIHPVVVGPYMADFDGDQMAIVVPISLEAQNEVKTKMITTQGFEYLNSPNFSLSKEMNIGIFTITYLENKKPIRVINNVQDAEKLHPGDPVRINTNIGLTNTTAGRVIFNSVLPPYIPFINKPMNAKDVSKVLKEVMLKNKAEFATTIDKMCKMSFEAATQYPQTISLDMFIPSPELKSLSKKLKAEPDVNKQIKILDEMDVALMEYLRTQEEGLYIQIASGAAKGGSQLRQIMVSKGLISNASGELLPPVEKALVDGFDPEQYLESAAGSRKGIIDRAVNTAFGGYAYRKMVYSIGSCEGDITNADCGTKRGLKLKITSELFGRMQGRYIINQKDRKVERLTEVHIGKFVELRSPTFCKSREICRTCYGDLIYQVRSRALGMLAAQACCSLSEKIMKCSTGLVNTEKHGIISLDELWDQSS